LPKGLFLFIIFPAVPYWGIIPFSRVSRYMIAAYMVKI